MKYFVSVAGNIGAGKSSLASLFAQHQSWKLLLEPDEENYYLSEFYQDMYQWSFHSQVSFLSLRSHQVCTNLDGSNSVIQDRSFYEDGEIFARNLYQQGKMNERDWKTYSYLYKVLKKVIAQPHLVVYLQASVSTLMKRVSQRGNPIEQAMSREYLVQLNELYDEWTAQFNLCPILTINTEKLDFVHNPLHFEQISQMILDRLPILNRR